MKIVDKLSRIRITDGKGFRLADHDCAETLGLDKDHAKAMLEEGVYVTAFSFPVVPKGEARIRVQLSAAHSDADVDAAIGAFAAARERVSH